MNEEVCAICGAMFGRRIAYRAGKQVCEECAFKIDQKKPVSEREPDFYMGYHGAYIFYEPVTVDKFSEMLDDYKTFGKYFLESIIVQLKYKYDHDREWTIENVVMEFDGSRFEYCWLNDWDEGQQQKFVTGWIKLSDICFE